VPPLMASRVVCHTGLEIGRRFRVAQHLEIPIVPVRIRSSIQHHRHRHWMFWPATISVHLNDTIGPAGCQEEVSRDGANASGFRKGRSKSHCKMPPVRKVRCRGNGKLQS